MTEELEMENAQDIDLQDSVPPPNKQTILNNEEPLEKDIDKNSFPDLIPSSES